MIHDVLAIGRLEYTRLKSQIAGGFRFLGVDMDSSIIYRLYVFAFGCFWLFAMWSFIVEQVYVLSRQISLTDTTALLDILPFLILVGGLIYLVALFREPPLKLSAPELLYIATSPISRSIVTVTNFVKRAFIPAVLLSLLGSLVMMFFAWRLGLFDIGWHGLVAIPVTLALTLSIGMLCWTLALMKQQQRTKSGHLLFWLIIPVGLLGAWILPDFVLLPGVIASNLLQGMLTGGEMVVLITISLVSFLMLTHVGARIHMTTIIEDSQVYARIHKFGFWGRVLVADVIDSIQTQARLRRRRVIRSRFPLRLVGQSAILGYSSVMLWRLSPGMAIRLFFMGVMLPSLFITALSMIGVSLQTWMLILVMAFQLRPHDLTRSFRTQNVRRHLRQYLLMNNLTLYMAGSIIPLFIMSLGVLFAVMTQSIPSPIVAFLLTISVLNGLGLCQVVETVRLPAHILPALQYEYSILFSGGAIILTWHLTVSLWGAFVVSALINILLAWLLYRSHTDM